MLDAMKRLFPVLVLLLALLAPRARAEAVREMVDILGAPPFMLTGVGIVVGLPNTGDKKDAALQMLKGYLDNNGTNFDTKSLTPGNYALVHVTAEMPAFGRTGQRFSVQVSSIGDAKNLTGGRLVSTSLTSLNKEDPTIYAVATGPVTVGVNSLTNGVVQAGLGGGATQTANYPGGRVLWEDRMGNSLIRLNLKRPNWNDANAIERQINQTPSLNPYLQEATMFADAEPSRKVAKAKDAGQVVVYVPRQHISDYVAYLTQILEVPVAVDRPARIVVNRAKNTIVITGDVRVNNATVGIQDKTVTIRPETEEEPAAYVLDNDTQRPLAEIDGPGSNPDLQGLIDTLSAMGLNTEQVIAVFEELAMSGAIRAEFIAQ